MKNKIFGIRVVSREELKDFKGVLIYKEYDHPLVELIRFGGNGHSSSFVDLDCQEVQKHNHSSGKHLLDFLYSKAKEFANEDEEIVITKRLAIYLIRREWTWVSIKKRFRERKQERNKKQN